MTQRKTYGPEGQTGVVQVHTQGHPTAQGALDQQAQTYALAEVQGQMLLARQFPRDVQEAERRILLQCAEIELAERAEYAYSKGGTDIDGASIRLAEVMAACWGNLMCGVREIERAGGYSTMEAYAWDLETNVRSVQHFKVHHRDDDRTHKALTSQRDIYEWTQNQASRRLRSRILALLPASLVRRAREACQKTLKASVKDGDMTTASQAMVDAFAPLGVSEEMLEHRLQRRRPAWQPGHLVQLRRVYTSLREGFTNVEDFFKAPPKQQQQEPAAPAPPAASKRTATQQQAKAPTKVSQQAVEAAPQAAEEAVPKPDEQPPPEQPCRVCKRDDIPRMSQYTTGAICRPCLVAEEDQAAADALDDYAQGHTEQDWPIDNGEG